MRPKSSLGFLALLVVFTGSHIPLQGRVQLVSMMPSVPSPQPLGTAVIWNVTATDTGPGPLTFQFSVGYSGGPFNMAIDFNAGTLAAGVWTAKPFIWTAIDAEAVHQVQVIAKDFTTGESASQTVNFTLTSRLNRGQATVQETPHPLVALV